MTATSPILIADDQRDVLEALRLLLKAEGHATVCVTSPGEALTAVKEHQPALALVDLNYTRDTTSGQEGIDLIGQLRALDAELPIVAMTAWSSIELVVKAMQAGAVLAQHQDCQIGVCYFGDGRTQSGNRRTVADHLHPPRDFRHHLPMPAEQVLPLAGVGEGDRRIAGQFGKPGEVVGGKVTTMFIKQLESTECLPSRSNQRHAEQGAGGVAGLAIDVVGNHRTIVCQIDPLGFARLHRSPHDPGFVRNAELIVLQSEGRATD